MNVSKIVKCKLFNTGKGIFSYTTVGMQITQHLESIPECIENIKNISSLPFTDRNLSKKGG